MLNCNWVKFITNACVAIKRIVEPDQKVHAESKLQFLNHKKLEILCKRQEIFKLGSPDSHTPLYS